jgi:hypothetical protein
VYIADFTGDSRLAVLELRFSRKGKTAPAKASAWWNSPFLFSPNACFWLWQIAKHDKGSQEHNSFASFHNFSLTAARGSVYIHSHAGKG